MQQRTDRETPLGVAANDAGVAALAARLAAYAFDAHDDPVPFTARLRGEYGWSARYTRRALAEYRRFVLLAATGATESTPSSTVDLVWHLHLLDTRRYWDEFCAGVVGKRLHHAPSRGGEAEAARHAAQYHATLDRYAALFGEAPPPDLWPDDRRAAGRCAGLGGVFARLAGAAGLAGIAGCATLYDSSQPGAVQGPDFLRLYLMLWAVALSLLALLMGVGTADPAPPVSVDDLDPEAIAFLAGGRPRARQTAELRLLRDGALEVDPRYRRLLRRGGLPRDATPLQAAIHRGQDAKPGTDRVAIGVALGRLREGLVAQGLIPGAAERRRQIGLAVLVAGPVFALGVLRLGFGVANGRPVGLLVLELIAAPIACLLLLRWRLSRTAAGRRLVRAAHAATDRGRRGAEDPELLTAMALFGTAAVSAVDFGDYARYVRQAYSGGDGGGGSCGGGGGGCGGGGGGCGG